MIILLRTNFDFPNKLRLREKGINWIIISNNFNLVLNYVLSSMSNNLLKFTLFQKSCNFKCFGLVYKLKSTVCKNITRENFEIHR